ncbi:MAG: hypothetical protein LBC02_13620 [Planctomycetaceae bacterium]|jgi:hypothetical protein|nr:hypothetical protein [Planctomycetaceae bacterium]
MSVSPTSSSVYVNYSSLFSQGGNKAFSAFQATAANYGNGIFQVRRASVSTLDILDLSPEGLYQYQSQSQPKTLQPETSAETTGNVETTNDVTLETPEISEAERVEIIRVNKNAVLERVNELLAEKGVEVPSDQSFELTTNFLDGTISVAGIENADLAASVNEALAGDEELIARMKKTREELGLTEPANTVSRNFTIGFESMTETPANAELEYKIDLFVNKPIPLLEDSSGTEIADTESAGSAETTATPEQPTFYLSVLLSNKPNPNVNLNLITALEDNKISENLDKSQDKEPENSQDSNEETTSTKTPDFIPNEKPSEPSEELPVEAAPAILPYSVFGSYFQTGSVVEIGADGVTLDWNLQFSNWDVTGNVTNSTTDNTETFTETQQIFKTLNIAGSTFYAYDLQNPQSPEEQAAWIQSQFANGFSQGSNSLWAEDFITQESLNLLGIFG